MREIGRIIRTYASHDQTSWNRIIFRLERVINSTVHASTGFAPDQLHFDEELNVEINPILLPLHEENESRVRRIRKAKQQLINCANKRKAQFNKHRCALQYNIGDLVWLRLHRRSDAHKREARKIHLVYDGPYRVPDIIKPNAFMIENLDGNIIGVFNSRQLKPHREPHYKRANDSSSSSQENHPRRRRLSRRKNSSGESDNTSSEGKQQINILRAASIPKNIITRERIDKLIIRLQDSINQKKETTYEEKVQSQEKSNPRVSSTSADGINNNEELETERSDSPEINRKNIINRDGHKTQNLYQWQSANKPENNLVIDDKKRIKFQQRELIEINKAQKNKNGVKTQIFTTRYCNNTINKNNNHRSKNKFNKVSSEQILPLARKLLGESSAAAIRDAKPIVQFSDSQSLAKHKASSTIHGVKSKSKKLTNHSRLFFSHSTVIGQFLTITSSSVYCRRALRPQTSSVGAYDESSDF
ncbi:hypothetical protein ALC57_06387 [Trachymyrmex cornetzi]|uniref:Integrase catalytic domain-containing protein n=1 Tax=Trachymyrmex cornetzi TaxID=471704 RepID=A0A151J973_9HYME|nr:hypothetical protein ALC57_06387 [Trachymyrmex cornetzi]